MAEELKETSEAMHNMTLHDTVSTQYIRFRDYHARQSTEKYEVVPLPQADCLGDEVIEPHPNTRRLCNYCVEMLDDMPMIFEVAANSSEPYLRSLDTFTRQGCRLCAIFFRYVDRDRHLTERCAQQGFEEVARTVTAEVSVDWGTVTARFVPTEIGDSLNIYFENIEEYPNVTRTGFTSTHLDSSKTWGLASEWLRVCKDEHTLCGLKLAHLQDDQTWLPTRLIDVGSLQDDIVHLSIIALDNIDLTSPYMALSHCWGTTATLKLTHATLDGLRKGITLSELPKTFRDAVKIVRKMNVHYLWIDKLCILQDSIEDWRKESVLMEQVYGNSLCTITAFDARDDTEGILVDRDPSANEPFQLHVRRSSGQAPQEFIVYDKETYYKNKPLLCRSWTYQERLLSPRSLGFSKREVRWECREEVISELFPQFELRDSDRKLLESKLVLIYPDRVGENSLLSIWGEIVTNYTRRELSFASDRLIAIAGIAKIISRGLGEYIAGMWKSHLRIELLWRINEHMGYSLAYRPLTYRAPSWSWVSVEGESWYYLADEDLSEAKFLWTIIDANVELFDNSEFGQVKGGLLELRGKLLPAKWTKRMMTEKELHGESVEKNGRKRVKYELLGIEHTTVEFDEEEGIGSCPPPPEILLLPAVSFPYMKSVEELALRTCGLIVCLADDLHYRRVGYFDVLAGVVNDPFANVSEQTVLMV